MTKAIVKVLPAMVLCSAGIAVSVTAAEAAIRCQDNYQIVQGNLISTPYCEDNYLATVARGYGTRVAARDIRNSPNRKREICQLVGRDIRVSEICAPYLNGSNRGRH
ncbi:MAG: hypothetical protein NW205_09235 [Hyphomicrobiaceae bacterium]|nr:hypothetical protein [Hyphomicrobiaceae bacterium]